jgi:DNA-binding GntR family transcriptional regulator
MYGVAVQPLSSIGLIAEELAAILQDEIVHGRLAPSSRLTEEEVALRYGISRSPVREALRLLERDNLVVRAARRGIWVAALSVRDFDEIYTCRIPLESLAAELAARSQDDRTKHSLRAVLRAMSEAYEARDINAFFDRDVDGSRLIYSLAGNATLDRLLAGLNKQALRYRFFAYARHQGVVTRSMRGTERIFKAILASDAALAKSLTETLIAGIWKEMRSTISDAFEAE